MAFVFDTPPVYSEDDKFVTLPIRTFQRMCHICQIYVSPSLLAACNAAEDEDFSKFNKLN